MKVISFVFQTQDFYIYPSQQYIKHFFPNVTACPILPYKAKPFIHSQTLYGRKRYSTCQWICVKSLWAEDKQI